MPNVTMTPDEVVSAAIQEIDRTVGRAVERLREQAGEVKQALETAAEIRQSGGVLFRDALAVLVEDTHLDVEQLHLEIQGRLGQNTLYFSRGGSTNKLPPLPDGCRLVIAVFPLPAKEKP